MENNQPFISIKRLKAEDQELAEQATKLFLDDHEKVSSNLNELLSSDSFYYIVAYYKGNIAGRLYGYEFWLPKNNEKELYLYEIDILENYQRKGIATSLIEYLKEDSCKNNISSIFVGTESDNIKAQGLYSKTGGKLEGHLPHYTYEIKLVKNL